MNTAYVVSHALSLGPTFSSLLDSLTYPHSKGVLLICDACSWPNSAKYPDYTSRTGCLSQLNYMYAVRTLCIVNSPDWLSCGQYRICRRSPTAALAGMRVPLPHPWEGYRNGSGTRSRIVMLNHYASRIVVVSNKYERKHTRVLRPRVRHRVVFVIVAHSTVMSELGKIFPPVKMGGLVETTTWLRSPSGLKLTAQCSSGEF
jgi:hypothetical protein